MKQISDPSSGNSITYTIRSKLTFSQNLTLTFILVGAVEKGMYANGFQSPTGQDSTVDTKDFQVMVSSLIISIFSVAADFHF